MVLTGITNQTSTYVIMKRQLPLHFLKYTAAGKHIGRTCRCRASSPSVAASTSFTNTTGETLAIEEEKITVGTDSTALLQISGTNTAPFHAEVIHQRRKTTCTALLGEPEDLFADTYTWLDGIQLRTGVAYLLSSGCKLAFGEETNMFTVTFEEAAANTTVLDMMVKGMAANASEEVRKQLEL